MYPLAKIVAVVTGHNRYFPEWKVSSSWIVNCFRVFEYIFGRKVGIRLEQIVSNGIVHSYTWENYLSTLESIIRERLSFRVVYIPLPQLATIAGQHQGHSPFRFAIALDTAQVKQSSPASWSHTVTGSNPYLIVAADSTTAPSDSVTAVSYNSVSLVSQVGVNGSLNWVRAKLWALAGPSTGANTVSLTGTGGFYAGSASYSGCQSTTAADATGSAASGNGVVSPLNVSVTSIADNCWMVAWFQAADQMLSAGTATTSHSTGGDGFEFFADNNGPKTPAGSITLQATWPSTNRVVAPAMTIAPSVASTTLAITSDVVFFE